MDYRDVYILDAEGGLSGIYNLSDNSLDDDANVAALTEMFDAAME